MESSPTPNQQPVSYDLYVNTDSENIWSYTNIKILAVEHLLTTHSSVLRLPGICFLLRDVKCKIQVNKQDSNIAFLLETVSTHNLLNKLKGTRYGRKFSIPLILHN